MRPLGWPEGLVPPGQDGWETAAVNWLLDRLPAEFRVQSGLHRQPIALARLAISVMAAQIDGLRTAYRSSRDPDLPNAAADELRRATGAIAAELAVQLKGAEAIYAALLVD